MSVQPTVLDRPGAHGEQERAGGVSVALLIKQIIESDDPTRVYGELVSLLALLPPGEYTACKAELREHFKRRLSAVDLDKAVKEARRNQKRAQLIARQVARSTEPGRPRPVVEVGGQFYEVVQSALHALALANKDNPSIFVDPSGRLVRVNYSTKQVPSITPLTVSTLRHHMSLSADYVSVKSTADDVMAIAVFPPLDVVKGLLELNPIEYPFQPLSGITELPIMRQDGSIHQIPGYDPLTEQVYIPGDLKIPEIPEVPTPEDVSAAVAILEYWLGDFPFSDNASKAAAIADTITTVIRPVVEGQVPLTLLDAPKQGSGKTILAQGIGIVGTGRIVPTNAPTSDEEEQRKKILTWLQTSPAIVIIDNVTHMLESSALNGALTSPYVEDRELGTNTLIRVENRAVWFASGNNIRVGDDTARRCIKCRLDAKMESPHKRDTSKFRIPGGVRGFFQWTIEHRAQLVAAALVLARNWYAKGKPAPSVLPIGSFEDWTTIIGGILEAAGIPDFLANMTEESGESSIDDITAEWKAFIEVIHRVYQGQAFTCAQLAKLMLLEDDTSELLRDALPSSITKNLDSYLKSKGVDREFPKHIGLAFKLKKGQIFGSLCLQWKGRNRENKVEWQIVDTAPAPSTESQAGPSLTTDEQMDSARKLLAVIERSGGKFELDSNGELHLKMPPNYDPGRAKELFAHAQPLVLQIYHLLGYPVPTEEEAF